MQSKTASSKPSPAAGDLALREWNAHFLDTRIKTGAHRNREDRVARHHWDGEADRLNPFRFLVLLGFVGGLVALIWWAYAAGHIKHVENVPPPITAPTASTAQE